MFVVKYHAKGHQTKYLGDNKAVVNKKCAMAFGEGLRGKFEQIQTEHCTLENLKVSDTTEMMYHNGYIKVGNIQW